MAKYRFYRRPDGSWVIRASLMVGKLQLARAVDVVADKDGLGAATAQLQEVLRVKAAQYGQTQVDASEPGIVD